ncbi:type III-B CRISPR-associated protein Cas10/Cmr2 [Nonomuraea sp. NPDC049419]|uniref:type III-B CRISPR-associated protein Cas10/Cmr2 n=1 Tax=Nonomuraea sp. NPDC049419 TaxID=3155772 RepID=UPI003420D756
MVMVTIPGVQRFVAESRRTADLFASSGIMSTLAGTMADVAHAGGEVVMPSASDSGVGIPNRVVVLAAAGTGAELARKMAAEAHARWERLLADANAKPVAGFPDVQWVVAPPMPDGYEAQWRCAQDLLRRRKRIRNFAFAPVSQKRVCSLSGRWPADPDQAGGHAKPGEFLSDIGLVKRFSGGRRKFPSTWSIASAPYRAGLIELAERDPECSAALAALELLDDELRQAGGEDKGLPGFARIAGKSDTEWLRQVEGAWCTPETWHPDVLRREYDLATRPDDETCEVVRDTAKTLRRRAEEKGIARLSPYLAVLAQDADEMGKTLGDRDRAIGSFREWHQKVSAALGEAGKGQRQAIEDRLGSVVYAGGDDLLALLPMATALRAAQRSAEAFEAALAGVVAGAQPTVSTALVFFHASSPLQSAVTAAQQLLEEAKSRARPGLAVAVQHRHGERVRWVSPWRLKDDLAAARLDALIKAMGGEGTLSPQLAMGVERDAAELGTLTPDWLERELRRRAVRHGMPEQAGTALYALCARRGDRVKVPVDALLVAQFLRGSNR